MDVSKIRFFFEHGGRVVQLPYNPESLEISTPGANETVEVISLGEINILRDPKLKDVSVTSIFPQYDTGYAVLTKGDFKEPEHYINFFDNIFATKDYMHMTVSGTHISMMPVSIENFSWKLIAQDEDTHFTLDLKKWREYSALTQDISTPTVKTASSTATAARSNVSGQITIGSKVTVNGRLHVSSYGEGPGKTLSNYVGKVSSIKEGRSHPYHITTTGGDWLGWVTSGAVKLA